MPLQSQNREAEQRGDDGAQQGARGQGRQKGNVPFRKHEKSSGIGPDAEVRHVPERGIARVATDEVPALRHQGEQEQARIGEQPVGRDEPRQKNEGSEPEEEPRDREDAAGLFQT